MVVLITTVAGVGGTGIGGLLGVLFHRNSEKIVSLLLSFAGGVMLCVVCLDLLTEALGQNADSALHVFLVIAMVIAGYGIVYLLNSFIARRKKPHVKHIEEQHPKTSDQLYQLINTDQ